MTKFWFRKDSYGTERTMVEVEANSREEAKALIVENGDWGQIDLIQEALDNGSAKIVDSETYFDCEDSEVYFYKEVKETE